VSDPDVLIEAGRLAAEGEPFALATVVSVRRPASARRGDRALVLPDGRLIGWVGGACSEPIVVREALRALAEGEPRLVRIGPPGGEQEPEPGVVLAHSMCASEGMVEVLIEPGLPRPLLAVFGAAPAARTLAELARTIGWRVTSEISPGVDAVVVASMGHGDEDALQKALAVRAGYVGLVASSRRAAVVLATIRERGVDEEALAHVRSPAGLDLGPLPQDEIAVAVLAELVAWRRAGRDVEDVVAEAVDPVCGMTVALSGAKEVSEYEGVTYVFCGAHCRRRFEAEPERYVTPAAR
jgi:xanthine dehydrogenase accessory factor